MSEAVKWTTSTAKELIAALHIGGWVRGHSALHPRYLRLHKTDLIADLRRCSEDWRCIWRITGDPNATGHHARDRRTIVIWLGR